MEGSQRRLEDERLDEFKMEAEAERKNLEAERRVLEIEG